MTFVSHDGPFIFNAAANRIPPGGTLGIWIGGAGNLKDCTVTATAHGLSGLVSGHQSLEVISTVTRAGPAPNDRFVDIVIVNRGPRDCPHTTVYLGAIRP